MEYNGVLEEEMGHKTPRPNAVTGWEKEMREME